MELWTEYEGRTIDGIFPLARLLQPEGRSAFFSTPNGSGAPTVIRLIESHFDDEEILARWRGVEALNHPNLVKLKQFGQTELDGTRLVYAVMEPADANLGEIIVERRLTAEEAREIAQSLAAALDALHSHGFVHEHVEPGNVFAVGEVIKLRSDCIREAPEGEEGQDLKRRDVHDLAVVLLRALTQQRTLADAVRDLPLPGSLDAIVRNGLNGVWGLAEITAALAPSASSRQAVSAASSDAADVPDVVELPVVAAPSAVVRTEQFGAEAEDGPSGSGMWTGLKIVLGLSVVVLLLVAWRMFHSRPVEPGNAAPVASSTVSTPAAVSPKQVPPEPKPSGLVPENRSAEAKLPAAADVAGPSAATPSAASREALGERTQWRVIAFTYNHEDQAKAKAAWVAKKHPELQPEVFRPNDHAPYLVTIGGVMSRADAFALAEKARSEGLARDVYAQNYRAAEISGTAK